MAGYCALLLAICLVLTAGNQRASALEFRVPKEGHRYDTSEMVYLFEREAGPREERARDLTEEQKEKVEIPWFHSNIDDMFRRR